jgi:L-threonylcarbamoyladenylate synthase
MAVVFQENDPELLQKIAKLWTPHALFISRTDTVYGIQAAANRGNEVALSDLKGRDTTQFITLVRDLKQANSLAVISEKNASILEKYWPGAITFILPTSEGGTIALRHSSFPLIEKLLGMTEGPLLSTSCNLHGSPVVGDAKEAEKIFGKRVSFLIDGGKCPASLPSTLVDLTGKPKVIRQGNIPFS